VFLARAGRKRGSKTKESNKCGKVKGKKGRKSALSTGRETFSPAAIPYPANGQLWHKGN
jgi:hypothetical protein